MALDRKRRRTTWREVLFWVALAVLYVDARFDLSRVLPASCVPWVVGPLIATAWVFALWRAVRFVLDEIRERRAYRTLHHVRDGGRWPLGEPYAVEVDPWCNGGRIWHTMRIGEKSVSFRPRSVFAMRFDFDGVDVVLVHASWIEIVRGAESVRVVPRSFADRERLLWELAVRFSDAIHRGIDETPPPVPTPPARVPIAAAPTGVDDLDRRMTGSGLASSLAGPMDRGNPAPPRKSGLGVGLFAPPPDEK